MASERGTATHMYINDREQGSYGALARIFKIVDDTFIPQHNKTILSLKSCKLSRQSHETTEERMGRLRIKAVECNYKENGKYLKLILC